MVSVLGASLLFVVVLAAILAFKSWYRGSETTNDHSNQIHPALLSDNEIRLISQRRIPSDDPDYPVALQLILQTDHPIQPVAFVIQTDGIIGMGNAVFRSGREYRLYKHVKQGIPADHLNWFAFEWDLPSFTAQDSLVVTVFSREPVAIVRIDRVPYEWP